MNSPLFRNVNLSNNGTAYTAAISRSVYIHGTHINDVDFESPGSSNASYGLYINYTGGIGGSDSDLHFNFPTFDNCSISCIYTNNLALTGGVAVSINNGYADVNIAGLKAVDIENSNAVNIVNLQIPVGSFTSGSVGIYAYNSSNLTLTNNPITMTGTYTGIEFVGTTNSIVSDNKCIAGYIASINCISLTSTSIGNTVTGNNVTNPNVGFNYDSTSLANDAVNNTCNGTITTCVSGTPTGVSPSFLATGSQLNGSPICSADGTGGCLTPSGTPVVNHAACIKAAGPPVTIGYCSTVVASDGSCTCN